MPDFEFTSPRGKTFTVTGPEGATQEQAWGMLQSQSPGGDVELYGWDPHAEETTQLSRDVGSFGRAATQAAKDFPATPGKMAGALWGTGKGLWNTLTNFETYSKLKDPEWWKNIPSAVADEFSANWGGTERARKHFETDPTGFLSEVSIPLTGGAGLARKGTELGVRGARAVLPTIGSVTSKATAADLRAAGEAGLKGGAEAAEYKAGAAGKPLTSEAKPTAPVVPFDDPLPAGLDMGGERSLVPRGGIKASTRDAAQKALAAQREAEQAKIAAEQAKLAPYGQAGQRLGAAGADPTSIVIGGLAGGRLGTAAAATAASPRAMGSAMYGLGAAERGLSGARAPTRTMIAAGAAVLLKDREAKKELSDEDVKTLRKAKRGDADSSTMLAASRILNARSTAVKSPYGGSDVGAPRPAPELTGETPLNLPGQSPGLGGAPAYGPSDAPKHGGKTLPEFVLQGMWDKLRTMPSRAGAAAWKAFEDPEHYDPKAPLEMAQAAMGRMPFGGGRGLSAGVGGGRLLQPTTEGKLKQLDFSGMRGLSEHLTPEELATVTARNVKSLTEAFKQMPSADEMAAAAYSGRAKRGWYKQSAKALIDTFGNDDAPRFASLLAALSPQTSVESNTENALRTWLNWTKAGRPTDTAAIGKILGESVQGTKGEASVLEAWRGNALRALQADDPTKVKLSGPKVNSFMLNLRNHVHEVTNDAWMARYARVSQDKFASAYRKDPELGKIGMKSPGYMAMSAATRRAAKRLSDLTGDSWTPAEIQETIWSWAKTLREKATSKEHATTVAKLLKAGNITHEEIADTPDFALLFTKGIYRNILEQAGYGETLAKVERELAGRGRTLPGGSPTRSEGGPFAQPAYERHLQRAGRRLDQPLAGEAE